MTPRVIAFDADVLIYSADSNNRLGQRITSFIRQASNEVRLIGSVLLVPELLMKPRRNGNEVEFFLLATHLSYLELLTLDERVAELATSLGVAYGLRTLDALHLATAVHTGADQFITNNRKDFNQKAIVELEVVYPEQLG